MPLSFIQVVIGVGIGLLGFLFVKQAVTYNTHEAPRQASRGAPRVVSASSIRTGGTNRSGSRESQYKTQPGGSCLVCVKIMYEENMQWLTCGHAFHKICYETLLERSQELSYLRRL